jgi:hypothetical protein
LCGHVLSPVSQFATNAPARVELPVFADIALHYENKINVRLVPKRDEYTAKVGQRPVLLSEVIDEGFRQLK